MLFRRGERHGDAKPGLRMEVLDEAGVQAGVSVGRFDDNLRLIGAFGAVFQFFKPNS